VAGRRIGERGRPFVRDVNVRTETMRAYIAEEMQRILQRLP
jgi:hypothetical protein